MFTRLYFIAIVLLFSQLVFAQDRQLSVSLGRSFHGTGDMNGVGFNVEFGKYISNNIEVSGSLGSNIHHDQYPLFISYGSNVVDASYRMVTGGIQLTGQLHFVPLRTKYNEISLGLGPVARYQSSSASGGYGITYPPAVNYPEPVFTFQQVEEQNIFSVGYLASLSYAYTFKMKYFIGANAFFQNDTNGDVVTQYGLRIGRRF